MNKWRKENKESRKASELENKQGKRRLRMANNILKHENRIERQINMNKICM